MLSEKEIERTLPPDRPLDGLEVGLGVSNSLSSTKKEVGDCGVKNDSGFENKSESRDKMQKKEGDYSGDSSLVSREEDWMFEEVTGRKGSNMPLSYRDVVKPRADLEFVTQMQEETTGEQEVWDGNLLLNETEEMSEGVRVTDTAQGPSLEFSEKEKKRLEKYWVKSLMIKILGGNVGYMILKRKLQLIWGKGGKIDLLEIGNGYLIVTFQSLDDYYFALEGGPWLVQNRYLTIQTWKRNFDPWSEDIKRVAVWVRLPGLPVDYYDRKFFFHLGNKIGKAIKVDEMTLSRARTMYARMCVEIDINTPLLPSYAVDGHKLKIEYEGLNLICFHCGRFGHDMEHCSQRKARDEAQKPRSEGQEEDMRTENATPENVPASLYGGWMIAQDSRRGRRTYAKENTNDRGGQKGGRMEKTSLAISARFAALGTDEEDKRVEAEEGMVRRPLEDMSNRGGSQRRDKQGPTIIKKKKKVAGTVMGRGAAGKVNISECAGAVRGKREILKEAQRSTLEGRSSQECRYREIVINGAEISEFDGNW